MNTNPCIAGKKERESHMKKIALILVVALLAATLITPALAETTTVAWWGNQTRNERTIAALDLFGTEHDGFTYDAQPAAWGDYWAKLAVAASGKELPDVIQMDYSYLNQYVNDGLLVDLAPFVKDGALDLSSVNAGIVNSGSVGEGIYAVCIGVNAPALLYNKTLLDAAGITVKDNMTMDEFMDLSREVYQKTGVKTNVGYGTAQVLPYIMRGFGKAMFTADGQLNITAEDLAYFFGIYETMFKEGWAVTSDVFAETNVGTVEQDPMVYFSTPDTQSWCAFYWSNQMSASQAVAASKDIELGITTWPSPDPVASNYLKPSQFLSVSRDAKDVALSVAILDFWTNSIPANQILLGERGIPASSVVADGIAPMLDETNQKVIAYINNVVSPNCSDLPAADPAASAELYKVIAEMQEYLLYGQVTAEEAAQQVMDAAASIL